MISKLTKKQEEQIPIYLKKWMDNGLKTTPIAFETAVEECRWLYREFLSEHSPEPIVFLVPSPLTGMMVAAALRNLKPSPKQLGSQLDSQLGSQLDSQLGSQLDSQLDSQLGSQLRSQLYSQLGSQLRSQKIPYSESTAVAWYWTWTTGFYDYVLHELLPKKAEEFRKYERFLEFSQRLNWIIPLSGFCVVIQNPTEIHLGAPAQNGIRRIHKDGGAAVKYGDGYSLYALNGTRVPDWLATKTAEEIDPTEVLKITNVEQRLVGIKKIGAHRMLDALKAKVISTKDDEYVLYEVTLEGSKEKLLQMKNPSEPKTHHEWVEPHIKTVTEALAWRRGITVFKEPVAKT